MNRKFTLVTITFFTFFSFVFVGCFKKNADGPPDQSAYDPHLTVTNTIAQLLSMPQGVAISDDIVISGLVVMDDKSGNYYKKIVIQDSTAGIEVDLDQNNLYNDYPVGRKVYIKCKGLYIGSSNGNPQLGYTPDKTGSISAIPPVLIDDYVVKANYPNAVVPDTFTIAQLQSLSASHLNTLVAIKNVEFSDANVGVPFAELASLSSATSLNLEDCSGSKAILRSSGYAKFQPYLTPSGNGVLVAIFTKYRTDIQLFIRDTSDVKFYGSRCGGIVPPPAGDTLLKQNFSTFTNDSTIQIIGWNNIAEIGGKQFFKSSYGTDNYAKISAFGSNQPVVKSWLITPAVNLAGKSNVVLSFKTKDGYNNGATLKAFVSTNYTGSGDPNTATWTDLAAAISTGTTTGYASVWKVASVALNFTVPVYIAFKYEGTTTQTTTYELANISITAH